MPSYDIALRQFGGSAMAFTREHLPLILPLLAEPFDRD